MKLSCAAESLIPIFPNRFESSVAKDSSDFGGGTFVADLELAGGELVFAVAGIPERRCGHAQCDANVRGLVGCNRRVRYDCRRSSSLLQSRRAHRAAGARSRVLSTMPTCGNVMRNAHTNCTSSRSLIVNSGRNPPAAGRKRGTLTVICACQQRLNKCSKCAASATASSCHRVKSDERADSRAGENRPRSRARHSQVDN